MTPLARLVRSLWETDPALVADTRVPPVDLSALVERKAVPARPPRLTLAERLSDASRLRGEAIGKYAETEVLLTEARQTGTAYEVYRASHRHEAARIELVLRDEKLAELLREEMAR